MGDRVIQSPFGLGFQGGPAPVTNNQPPPNNPPNTIPNNAPAASKYGAPPPVGLVRSNPVPATNTTINPSLVPPQAITQAINPNFAPQPIPQAIPQNVPLPQGISPASFVPTFVPQPVPQAIPQSGFTPQAITNPIIPGVAPFGSIQNTGTAPTTKYGPPPTVTEIKSVPVNSQVQHTNVHPHAHSQGPNFTQPQNPTYPNHPGGNYPSAGNFSGGIPHSGGAPEPQQALTEHQRIERLPSPPGLIPNQDTSETPIYNTKTMPIPPTAASDFIAIDQGVCSPRYIRSSVYSMPNSPELAKQSCLPIGLILQPLADPQQGESAVPIIDFGPSGPLRCGRCRAYINSLNTFTQGGRAYICFYCQHINSIPDDYFSPIGPDGIRMDTYQRPELFSGSVEFIASSEYISKPIEPLSVVFLIEATQNSIKNGVLQTVAASLKAIINSLPETNNYRFGFLTFGETIQFYQLSSSLSKPKILCVGEIDDMFLPCSPDGNLLVSTQNSKLLINQLLENLPGMFQNTMEVSSCLGSALRTGAMMLKTSGGKIICFQNSLPSLAPGELKPRMNLEIIGTDRERELYKSQSNYYERFAENCAQLKIGVDLFLLSESYLDVASTQIACKMTGGRLYFFPRFSILRDRLHVHHELHRVLTRTQGYDATLKIRTSTGLDISEKFGDFRSAPADEMDLSCIDCNKSFGCVLQVSGKIPDESFIGVQAALLYTTAIGERRIRIHNWRVQTTSQLSKVFAAADLETLVFLTTCKAIQATNSESLQTIRKHLIDRCVDIVYPFRKFCSTKAFNPGVLILPEALKLYPLYVVCLMKNILLKLPQVR